MTSRYEQGLPPLVNGNSVGGHHNWFPSSLDTDAWREEQKQHIKDFSKYFPFSAWLNSFDSIPNSVLWEFAQTKVRTSMNDYFVKGDNFKRVLRIESQEGNSGHFFALYNVKTKVFEQWFVHYSVDTFYSSSELADERKDAFGIFGVEREY